MEKMTVYYIDANGNRIPVNIKVNKKLTKKNNTRIKAAVAATALVLSIGSGIVLSGCLKSDNFNPVNNTPISESEIKEELRFNPNTKESIIEKAVLLIKEAARCGKELDAEDATLAVIAANSNELSLGFMGELFGERANQTYTYDMIADAYLKACLIQLETVGVTKNDTIEFNIENVFASNEDYEYLTTLRALTRKFNNSTDEKERNEIINELNTIALDLCTFETLDISSSAGVLAMLSLDGMRIVTNNMDTPILHDDIRDEMFGNNAYSCEDVNVLPTSYSNRVSDLKLDSIKTKLENAVLSSGKTVILNDIINAVKEQTKDVKISDFDAAAEINKLLNNNVNNKNNSNTPAPSKPTQGGKGSNSDDSSKDKDEVQEPEIPEPEKDPDAPVITPTIQNPEVTTPTEPDISVEENVTPEPGEEILDNKEEAEEELEDEWQKAQNDSNQGSVDGMNYGLAGASVPSLSGKSDYYVNAFMASYNVYYQVYLDAKEQQQQLENEQSIVENTEPQATDEAAEEVQEEQLSVASETEEVPTTTVTYDLNNLSVEQLEELKAAAVGTVPETEETQKEYTK